MAKTASSLSIALVSGALLLAGCASSIGLPASTKSDGTAGADAAPQPSFAQFSDIPIPTGAKMDMERSLVLGGNEAWIGRLVMTTSHGVSDMFDFFKQRSGEFGWDEITSVRSKTSVLTFSRADRVMTVQIEPKTITGSEMSITVAPREMSNVASAPGGSMGGSASPPPMRAPVQRIR